MEVIVEATNNKQTVGSRTSYQPIEHQHGSEKTSNPKLNNGLEVSTHEPQKNLAVNNQQTNSDGIAKNFQMHDIPLQDRFSIIATTKEVIYTVAQECSNFLHGLIGHGGDYLQGAYHYTDADVPYESYKKFNQEITEFINNVGGEIERYSTGSNDTFNSKTTHISSTANYLDVFMNVKLDAILQNEKALKELPNQSQIENPEAIRNKFMQFIKQDNVYDFIEEHCPDKCKQIAKEIRAVDLSDIKQIDNIRSLAKRG